MEGCTVDGPGRRSVEFWSVFVSVGERDDAGVTVVLRLSMVLFDGVAACCISDCRRACGEVDSVVLCDGGVFDDFWHVGVAVDMVGGVVMSIGGERFDELSMVAMTATIGGPSTGLIRSSRRQVCYVICIGHFCPGREGAVD